MNEELNGAARRLRTAIDEAGQGLVERGVLVDLVVLSAVAGEHVLVIGPPGTAKSAAVRRVVRALGGTFFDYLLGRFTEPNEIFGPVDLRKLKEGLVEIDTHGMLPEADVAFLDEVFLGSTAILNTLLGILNERTFTRGHTRMTCPLRLCVGAANALPRDESLAAFADRFLVRVFLDSIADPQLEELLTQGWRLEKEPHQNEEARRLEDLDLVTKLCRETNLEGVRPRLAEAIRQLRQAGIALSDRRLVRSQRLVVAAAALDGREVADERDLWPLLYVVPTAEQQATAREALRPLLAAADSKLLPSAAEDASQGLLARARRLVETATQLLQTPPAPSSLGAWRLKLEGVAREIDAGFAPALQPAELRDSRARIVAALTALALPPKATESADDASEALGVTTPDLQSF